MTTAGLPWRGPGPERPELPLPPGKVPLRRDGSWRKRWRYLGAFSDELLVCAARVQVGPVGQTFWAIWERADGVLHERTRTIAPGARPRRGLDPGPRGQRRGADRLGAGERRDAGPDRGRGQARGRARARLPARGRGRLGRGDLSHRRGGQLRLDAQATWSRSRCDVRIGDASDPDARRAGSRTSPAAITPTTRSGTGRPGVGETRDGRAVGWNLVGRAQRPGAGLRARDLGRRRRRRRAAAGELRRPRGDRASATARLEFSAETERRSEQSRPFAYSYRQPFGTFTGSLPGGLELASGLGVMEHHEADLVGRGAVSRPIAG